MGKSVCQKVEEYTQTWEKRCYKNGIPDQTPIGLDKKVPSYQRIAICLLKNDLNLSGLGYESPKSKYYSILKRIEIDAREYDGKQYKLKL